MTSYYQLQSTEPPWGDYGDVLQNGFLEYETTSNGHRRYFVCRAGPFVPPITQPFGDVVVTDEFKNRLEEANFTGLGFLPADYGDVIRINWHEWDHLADDPEFYPESGEPEDYLERAQHDLDLIAEMPRLWVWDVASTEGLQRQGSNSFYHERHPGTDVAREYTIIWVGERLKSWLARNAAEWSSPIKVIPRDLPNTTEKTKQ